MKEVNVEKLADFIIEMKILILELRNRNSIAAHRNIDESFYMEKIEEFSLLKSQLEIAHSSLRAVQARVEKHYDAICPTWRKDISFLNLSSTQTFCHQ